MIVVAMTSWVKRIGNVKPVVENIMNGTLQPDRLYLSLSVEEFSNRELGIPKDLVDYFNSDERLIINWVDGENTKCMKKVFPIVKYLDDDDIILPVDDDIMYPLDYIEKRIEEYNKHHQPISGLKDFNKSSYIYRKHKVLCNIGHACLFTKKMITHWEEYVDDKILKSNNDDTCYAILEWLNGFVPQTCIYYGSEDIVVKYAYNEVEPSGKLKQYTNGDKLVELHCERINELTCSDYKDSFNFFNITVKKKVIVTMTSWVKRIGSVKRVAESIMSNTVKPDRLYLNLSKTEFENIQLPKDLVEYFNSDERLVINWVDGENTKSMKKVFPILEYLDEDDIIITADDDILFPSDLIESRINDFNKYKNRPITSNESKCGIGDAIVISPLSLYQKKMFNNWDKYVNETVIRTYNDDRTYLYILYLNGYIAKPASKYHEKYLKTNFGYNEEISPMKGANIYPIGRKYDEIVRNTVYKLTGATIKDSFNFFNIERHDCVMVYSKSVSYGKDGVDTQEMTCGDHLEMEYVIASLKKYCSSWVGRIFIVGSEPPERVKNDVIHIPCDDPYTHCKDANIIHKLRYACENIPDLSDDFLMISDDQIVTKESRWGDMKPRIVRMYSDWVESKWDKNRKMDFWHESLYKTLNLFTGKNVSFWEPHIWSPMNKYKFVEMCKKYNYQEDISCITQSLYYNFINETPIRGFDHLHIGSVGAKIKVNFLTLSSIPRHLSWTDAAFKEKRFRDILDDVVGFNETPPSKMINSKGKNIDAVKKIREGIKNGTIIKEYQPDGTYIWKKIKK